jgi:hypothetical protein
LVTLRKVRNVSRLGSQKTLSRLPFTGIDLLDSIRLLAEGQSVTDTALDCGYSSVSAFIAAFKVHVWLHAGALVDAVCKKDVGP